MARIKSITVDEFIKALQDLKEKLKRVNGVEKPGNLEIFMSADTEGNYFNSLNKEDMFRYDKNTEQGNVVTLWPWEDDIEL